MFQTSVPMAERAALPVVVPWRRRSRWVGAATIGLTGLRASRVRRSADRPAPPLAELAPQW